MMKTALRLTAITGLAFGLSTATLAQDISAEPNSGTITLDANFTPDPTTMEVTSGGSINVSEVIPGCSGYISDAPDVRLTFTAQPSPDAYPLYIYALSSDDTTLVINAPDGEWYCNDDGNEGLDPSVVFSPAMSGDYEIWVGSYDEDEFHDAKLSVSELEGQ